MKDILVNYKKGCIICTSSFVALATQTAGVMLTAVRDESHSSQKCFVLILVLFWVLFVVVFFFSVGTVNTVI